MNRVHNALRGHEGEVTEAHIRTVSSYEFDDFIMDVMLKNLNDGKSEGD